MSSNTAITTAGARPLAHERTVIVFSGLVLAMLLAALDSTIVATALPRIVGDLGGLAHISWVVTAYLLAQTIVTPLYGKLGDLYGRKGVLQAAILLFLIGSALCGLSRSMTELILFRAIQGLGGGGLVVTTQAVVGDIVAPRERGRYQGIFGAVFAVASVAGPLLGGYFTSNISWRWIFYINLPIGGLALMVVGLALPARAQEARHVIDYMGAALFAVALSGIVVVSDLAPALSWNSPAMALLAGAVIVALGSFVLAERRAAEPVLPMRLFRNRVFVITSAVGLIVGVALFGSVTYMPLFLQVVKRSSPTASGLELTPMMAGVVLTSVGSGLLISRLGRYKIFPIIGTAMITLALFLLSTLSPQTPVAAAAMMMLVLGLGLGMVMQVLVIAVQNAVDYADLGVATSGAILFRLIGGSLGTAVLGGIFTSALTSRLGRLGVTAGEHAGSFGPNLSPDAVAQLPLILRQGYEQAFTAALDAMFLIAAALALLAFLLSWLLPEPPLRKTVAGGTAENYGSNAAQAFAMPSDPDSLAVLLRGIVRIADRDIQRRYISAIVRRAGVDLQPAAAWLLVKIEENSAVELVALGRSYHVELDRLESARADLLRLGYVSAATPADGGKKHYNITAEGCSVFNRIVKARREHLAELTSDWSANDRETISALVRELARRLIPEAGEQKREIGNTRG